MKGKLLETYSYSKLNLFNECPYAYYEKYILNKKMATNMLSDYGKLIHNLFEMYYKGELKKEDLLITFVKRFKCEIKSPICLYFDKFVSKDLTANYFNKTYDYFCNFHGFDEDYKVVAVEDEFESEIDDFTINGVIDLVLKDNDDNYIIVDHKSSNPYSKSQLINNQKQLYIYAMSIKDKYGKYPVKMIYNFYNSNTIKEIKFSKVDYETTMFWIFNTINNIRICEKFNKNNNNKMFCYSFCKFCTER